MLNVTARERRKMDPNQRSQTMARSEQEKLEKKIEKARSKEMNSDPITGASGSHPVGTGVGAVGGGIAGAAIGTVGGPIGAVVGAAIGATAGGLAGKAVA